jgi:hypothetical protein
MRAFCFFIVLFRNIKTQKSTLLILKARNAGLLLFYQLAENEINAYTLLPLQRFVSERRVCIHF